MLNKYFKNNISFDDNYSSSEILALYALSKIEPSSINELLTFIRNQHRIDDLNSLSPELNNEIIKILVRYANTYLIIGHDVQLHGIIHDCRNTQQFVFKIGDGYYCRDKRIEYCKRVGKYYGYHGDLKIYLGHSYFLCCIMDMYKIPTIYTCIFNSFSSTIMLDQRLELPMSVLDVYEFEDKFNAEKCLKLYDNNINLLKIIYSKNLVNGSR